jgi:hypothetical protein
MELAVSDFFIQTQSGESSPLFFIQTQSGESSPRSTRQRVPGKGIKTKRSASIRSIRVIRVL